MEQGNAMPFLCNHSTGQGCPNISGRMNKVRITGNIEM
jgi:hypothetical protein